MIQNHRDFRLLCIKQWYTSPNDPIKFPTANHRLWYTQIVIENAFDKWNSQDDKYSKPQYPLWIR